MQFHQLKRREFVALLGCAATWPLAARAQEPKRTIRVGFLGAASPIGYEPRIWSLLNGFRDLGYVEGKNFTIEYRWAQGNYERLPELATELVRLNVDVLVTHGTPGTLAAKQATTSIPIVMAASGDAVATGIVPSLSRPGGNVTGSSILNPELVAKRLELVKELVATATQVGFLFNAANLSDRILRQTAEATGKLLRISIEDIPIQTSVEIPAVLSRAARHIDALATTDDGMFIVNTKIIANTATENRLPSIGFKELVQAGGLISYAPDLLALFRHAAVFVDKIVRGAKPGDIPIEQPTKFELALNIKTAKILGLDVPLSFYWRADEVIE